MKNSKRSLTIWLLIITAPFSYSGSATWKLNAGGGDWNSASAWTPATVPNGPDDIATFAVSNTVTPGIFADTEINSIVYTGGTSFTTKVNPGFTLTISGNGITNNSGKVQTFIATVNTIQAGEGSYIVFTGAASAGTQTVFSIEGAGGNYASQAARMDFFSTSAAGSSSIINNVGVDSFGAATYFHDSASAGTASLTNVGGFSIYAGPGQTYFEDNSSADNATITNKGATSFALGGSTGFSGNSNAANATITNEGSSIDYTDGSGVGFSDSASAGNAMITSNGGGVNSVGIVSFSGTSTAASATIICNGAATDAEGGAAYFSGSSSGGAARVELFGKGTLWLTYRDFPQVSIGSLEGEGYVYLEGNELIVGSNDLDTIFSGIISDGSGYTGGSITKIGDGQLTLRNANTYSGETTVNGGTLMVNNTGASGTGSGPVQVSSGTLSGNGIIAGAVTLGTDGFFRGATLAPGRHLPGQLVIQDAVTFRSDAIYQWKLSTRSSTASKLVANGVTIDRGALFSFAGVGHHVLPAGTVFTAIENTAATPISGAFINLADGTTGTVGSNTFQASYEGGDGNDLTLTVLP
jgi:autotransporter-associated beta strand protein